MHVTRRLKRLGTDIYSVQIIPPAMNSLQILVDSLKSIRELQFAEEQEMSKIAPCNDMLNG